MSPIGSNCDITNLDANSAVKRAKTDSCKKELREFATKLIKENNIQIHLKRSCRLDTGEEQFKKLTCASISDNRHFILDDHVFDVSTCLGLCFSYGHSHGGYHTASNRCFCGDNALGAEKTRECDEIGELWWYRVNGGIYNSKLRTTKLKSNSSTNNQVKIAFLLMLKGSSAPYVHRLLRNIYSRKHIYYLHIDKRDNDLFDELVNLEKDYDNIIVTRSRFITIWGGPSLLKMVLDAIAKLYQYNWDYLINLSETDFPLKPISELEMRLGQDLESIYLKSHNIKGYNFIKKQGLDRNFYQCEARAWRMGKRILPRGIVYSGGSDWFALPRKFCRYVIDNLNNAESLVQPLIYTYNYTLLPVESFFHTLASNSEFCDKVIDNNLRMTNWRRKQGCKCQHKDVVDWCGCSPLVYRLSDWEKLNRTARSPELYFSRKFEPTISSSIINLVERHLVQKLPIIEPVDQQDTRYWQTLYQSDRVRKSSSQTILVQFGLFCLDQMQYSLNIHVDLERFKLEVIFLYFEHDRFVGYVYQYCNELHCIQFLVEKNRDTYLQRQDNNCFKSNRQLLIAIEVNHGFDIGERMFRDYQPLSHFSEIVVYHEWLVAEYANNFHNTTDQLQFSWSNSQVGLELMQEVKLKTSAKPTRLTLAHRLNLPKPLISALWTLTISQRKSDCLDYSFLIFDDSTFSEKKIKQDQFNKFYTVTKTCIDGESLFNISSNLEPCNIHEWSLSKQRTAFD